MNSIIKSVKHRYKFIGVQEHLLSTIFRNECIWLLFFILNTMYETRIITVATIENILIELMIISISSISFPEFSLCYSISVPK